MRQVQEPRAFCPEVRFKLALSRLNSCVLNCLQTFNTSLYVHKAVLSFNRKSALLKCDYSINFRVKMLQVPSRI